jgi:plastocyanin
VVQGSGAYNLAEGASATIAVRFTPAQSGTRTCTLDLDAPCADVSLAGVGVSSAACQLDATSLDFGTVDVGQAAERSVTITNAGAGVVSGTASVAHPDFSIVGDASYDLGARETFTITVRFAPAAGGDVEATLETGSAECSDVTLTGRALELNSGGIGPGSSYGHTFSTAGSYSYFCAIHPVMRGTVIVDASGPASASVSIVNSSASGFSPSSVTVAPGGTVTWTNNDFVTHTVTSD